MYYLCIIHFIIMIQENKNRIKVNSDNLIANINMRDNIIKGTRQKNL